MRIVLCFDKRVFLLYVNKKVMDLVGAPFQVTHDTIVPYEIYFALWQRESSSNGFKLAIFI